MPSVVSSINHGVKSSADSGDGREDPSLMMTPPVDKVTVSDLVSGWDDLRLLLHDPDPDRVHDAVSLWPRRRLVIALAAAITAIGPDSALPVSGRPVGPPSADSEHRTGLEACGHASGHVAASEWPS